MFAKVFSQIFDSSIAEDYLVRHVFIDFLILCDRHGVVDMTVEAISRRTNVPEEMVRHAIERLSQPDSESRSDAAEGRRIVPLDSHRNWGWQVVNYQHYRDVVDDENRKAYFRDRMKDYRNRLKGVKDSEGQLKKVTQAEAEAKVEVEAKAKKSKASCADAHPKRKASRIPTDFQVTEEHREWARGKGLPSPDLHIEAFRDYWLAKAGKDGLKENWDATFRTWMRNEKNWHGAKNGTNRAEQRQASNLAALDAAFPVDR